MPNPLLVGGLVVGGAVAAWRLVRERGRVRRMAERLARQTAEADRSEIIRLERDPGTGVYAPRKDR